MGYPLLKSFLFRVVLYQSKNKNIAYNINFNMVKSKPNLNKLKSDRRIKYDIISYKTRVHLLNYVFKEQMSAAQASRKLQIRQTTGRLIVRTYRDQNRVVHKPGGSDAEQYDLPLPKIKLGKNINKPSQHRMKTRANLQQSQVKAEEEITEVRCGIKVENEEPQSIPSRQPNQSIPVSYSYPIGAIPQWMCSVVWTYHPFMLSPPF